MAQILLLELRDNDGKALGEFPYLHFPLTEKHSFAILGINNEEFGGFESSDPYHPTKATSWGKLKGFDKNVAFLIYEYGKHFGWDFDKYDNPEIFLLTHTNPEEN